MVVGTSFNIDEWGVTDFCALKLYHYYY